MAFDDDSTRALVPATPPGRLGTLTRWVQRIVAYAAPTAPSTPPAPTEIPVEVYTRLDALTDRLAAHEEHTHKRLEESENRTLHLMQQRFTALERDLLTTLREEISREVEEKTASLRARIAVAVGVSLGAVVLAIWTLVR
jgi:hypothetical protein